MHPSNICSVIMDGIALSVSLLSVQDVKLLIRECWGNTAGGSPEVSGGSVVWV